MPDAAASPVARPSSAAAQALAPLTLILGGARSGKSAYAESLLAAHPEPVYIATAEAGDAEMAARIQAHRARRDARWINVEAPFDLAGALAAEARPGRALLVDCLTLWLSNLMGAGADIETETARLAAALPGLAAPAIFVANEVGMGIVPEHALAREFRDHAGRLNQRLAAICQRVVFVAAGLPLVLKEPGR